VQETADGSAAQNGVNGHGTSLANDETLDTPQSTVADIQTRYTPTNQTTRSPRDTA